MKIATLEKIHELLKAEAETPHFKRGCPPGTSNGYDLGVRGGETFKTESRAIWHGKRWMKECGRTGTITAIPAIDPEPYHIIEW